MKSNECQRIVRCSGYGSAATKAAKQPDAPPAFAGREGANGERPPAIIIDFYTYHRSPPLPTPHFRRPPQQSPFQPPDFRRPCLDQLFSPDFRRPYLNQLLFSPGARCPRGFCWGWATAQPLLLHRPGSGHLELVWQGPLSRAAPRRRRSSPQAKLAAGEAYAGSTHAALISCTDLSYKLVELASL